MTTIAPAIWQYIQNSFLNWEDLIKLGLVSKKDRAESALLLKKYITTHLSPEFIALVGEEELHKAIKIARLTPKHFKNSGPLRLPNALFIAGAPRSKDVDIRNARALNALQSGGIEVFALCDKNVSQMAKPISYRISAIYFRQALYFSNRYIHRPWAPWQEREQPCILNNIASFVGDDLSHGLTKELSDKLKKAASASGFFSSATLQDVRWGGFVEAIRTGSEQTVSQTAYMKTHPQPRVTRQDRALVDSLLPKKITHLRITIPD